MISIRPLEMRDQDDQLAVDIGNAAWVDYPEALEEWQEYDDNRSQAERWSRFFAEMEYGWPRSLDHEKGKIRRLYTKVTLGN